jgi:hypothetical protein
MNINFLHFGYVRLKLINHKTGNQVKTKVKEYRIFAIINLIKANAFDASFSEHLPISVQDSWPLDVTGAENISWVCRCLQANAG